MSVCQIKECKTDIKLSILRKLIGCYKPAIRIRKPKIDSFVLQLNCHPSIIQFDTDLCSHDEII